MSSRPILFGIVFGIIVGFFVFNHSFTSSPTSSSSSASSPSALIKKHSQELKEDSNNKKDGGRDPTLEKNPDFPKIGQNPLGVHIIASDQKENQNSKKDKNSKNNKKDSSKGKGSSSSSSSSSSATEGPDSLLHVYAIDEGAGNSSDTSEGWEYSNKDYSKEEPGVPLMKRRMLSPAPVVKKYLKNVILMHMISPSRAYLVPLIHKHYAPYFAHQIFTGPRNSTVGGFNIEGHDVVGGTMQYVALVNVINRLQGSFEERKKVGFTDPDEQIEGYLFLADDVMLHPWMLYGRNKNVAWCAGMGIANAQNWRPVKPVPAMSAEKRFTKNNWPFWFKGRVKMLQIFNETSVIDEEARTNLGKAADLTPQRVFAQSNYRDPQREFCCSDSLKTYNAFYTIVDTFYVPAGPKGRTSLRWAKFAQVARDKWLHLETAIPSTLRMVSPSFEVLRIQYYWSSMSAAHCKRYRWMELLDGFHRCRHDHKFVQKLYSMSHAELAKMGSNQQLRREMKEIDGIDRSWNPDAYKGDLEWDDRMRPNWKKKK